jgi:hypothetical protein
MDTKILLKFSIYPPTSHNILTFGRIHACTVTACTPLSIGKHIHVTHVMGGTFHEHVYDLNMSNYFREHARNKYFRK